MAVYTEVSFEQADRLLSALGLGSLTGLRGIQGGIENTNYFATTTEGEWVLTLFERLTHEQLPFYLHLMKHLAQHGIPVPEPQSKADGAPIGPGEDDILHTLCGKPAAVVNRLLGHSELAPTPAHCAAVGAMLAHRRKARPRRTRCCSNRATWCRSVYGTRRARCAACRRWPVCAPRWMPSCRPRRRTRSCSSTAR